MSNPCIEVDGLRMYYKQGSLVLVETKFTHGLRELGDIVAFLTQGNTSVVKAPSSIAFYDFSEGNDSPTSFVVEFKTVNGKKSYHIVLTNVKEETWDLKVDKCIIYSNSDHDGKIIGVEDERGSQPVLIEWLLDKAIKGKCEIKYYDD